jgi:hypothetical protein
MRAGPARLHMTNARYGPIAKVMPWKFDRSAPRRVSQNMGLMIFKVCAQRFKMWLRAPLRVREWCDPLDVKEQ